jgi:hypothetical protein
MIQLRADEAVGDSHVQARALPNAKIMVVAKKVGVSDADYDAPCCDNPMLVIVAAGGLRPIYATR